MKVAERIVMVALLLILFGGGVWLYFSYQYKQTELRDAIARGEYQIPKEPEVEQRTEPTSGTETESVKTTQEDWRAYYPVVVPIIIGSTTVHASVADSLPERIKGLSDTPYLPDGIVKLFAFGAEGEHSIWMKDMNYPIDIIWVAKAGQIVHIKKDVSPATYPESFASPKPSWYVIETPAGFVEKTGIKIGDEVIVPE